MGDGMDLAQRGQLAFILTLIGGIVGIVFGLFFGLMGLFFASILDYASRTGGTAEAPPPPASLFLGLFGFFGLLAIAGGVTMIFCATRLRLPAPASRSAAIGAIVGGALCF